MRIEFTEVTTLPVLAWCARVETGSSVVSVHHGPSVETRPGWFAEGPWDGQFEAGDFLNASFFAGTGGMVEGGRVRFGGSSDRGSAIFSIAKNGMLFVSNSAVFVMVAAGEEPDYTYPFYPYDQVAIWRQGLHCQNGRLRLGSSHKLRLHFSAILSLDSRGSVTFETHRVCAPPTNYESCRALLSGAVTGIIANALDAARKRPLEPIAGISRGYDSPASATLASQAGCREAYTYTDSRRSNPDADSGAEIARILGLRCAVVDRWDYLKSGGMPEAEFGLFPLAAPVPLAGAEDVLRGRVIITGHLGERIWGRGALHASDFSCTWNRFTFFAGQVEFRLRVGMNLCPLLLAGVRHSREFYRINNSDELSNWSIGGDYDRPMARRIAEDAGIPRTLFGQEKRGSGSTHFNSGADLSPRAVRHYHEFRTRLQDETSKSRRHYWRVMVSLRHRLWNALGNGKRVVSSSAFQRRFPFILNIAPIMMAPEWTFTFQWSFDCLRERYNLSGNLRGEVDCTDD